MRLNRFLAASGLGSRRKMDELIQSGRVRINGQALEGPGQPVNPQRDVVTLDGEVIRLQEELGVWLLNKPVGYLTTMSDPQGRPTVAELVEHLPFRVFPVGRLDLDSSGLLIFTNDGKLAHRLAHPRHEVEKEYQIVVAGRLTPEASRRLEGGIQLEEGITSPARLIRPQVNPIGLRPDEDLFNLVIREGWKRQVRRMCEAVGLPVRSLTRLRFEIFELGELKPGSLRRLKPGEVEKLRKRLGL